LSPAVEKAPEDWRSTKPAGAKCLPLACALIALCAVWLLGGCATYDRKGLEPATARALEQAVVSWAALAPELEQRILSFDPENVTESDIRDVLSRAPAPRIINIHGGIYPVHMRMVSFSEFLIGLGYPACSITNPGDGTYTFSCYESSQIIAGVIAWYYEKEGLRPIMVGHSQGGMQAVKVLQLFAAPAGQRIPVFNPLLWKKEHRCEIVDPLTGLKRPVVGLQLPYATAMGAGGLTRLLPNQWGMNGRLRTIPDSVEEFTGFYKGRDLLGGDFLGYGPANHYRASGTAAVRNFELPAADKHGAVPDTKHLLRSRKVCDWINDYRPGGGAVNVQELSEQLEADCTNILWAADVWYSIKKHWVLELQRRIRAKSTLPLGA
jgi:hypothetical protein